MSIISFDKKEKILYRDPGDDDGPAGSEDRCRSLKNRTYLVDFIEILKILL